jgi:hypothetical protein
MGYSRTVFILTRRFVCFVILAALAFLADGKSAFGQGIITGSIGGSITDQTGAVISNATVTAVNYNTQTTLQGRTTSEGTFFISNVPIGTYTVTIEATGFGKTAVNKVQVAAGNTTTIARQALAPSGAAETVQVEAGAAELMNTESAQGEVVIDSAQLQTLPVTGAFDNVTLMVPGVVQTHSDGMSNTNGVNFSVNGERGRANNSEIDGQSNNDNSIGGPSFFFSNQDALQEIQVITNDFNAQYGRNMGAVINYITKTGTNRFHGSGFEMYVGSFLSSLLETQKDPQFGFCPSGVSPSTGCSSVFVPRFVQNNWGGSLGGPFLKDKLFFFGSTFWSHSYTSGAVDTTGASAFPDPTGLKQLQAAFPGNAGVAALVQNGPYAIATGNPAPVSSSITTIPVTNGTTTANIEVAGVQRTLPYYVLDQEETGRLDYQMTSKDRFYLRYIYQNNPYIPGLYLTSAATNAAGGFVNVTGITHEVGGDWTHTFTPSITNQLRYSFQQSTIAFESGAIPSCTIASFTSCTSSVGLGAGLATYGYQNNLPQGRVVKVNQVQDNDSWNIGRHTLQFGGEYDHQNSPNAFLPGVSGVFNFGASTGLAYRNPTTSAAYNNGLTRILEGVSETALVAGSPTIPFKEPDVAFYIQDNWKIRHDLTLNMGVRYEFFGQSINLLHNESVAQQTGSNPFWSKSLPLSATTFPHIDPFYKNIEPRVGLAYSPDFLPKAVIHAGFAINVDPEFYNIFLDMAAGAPVVNAGNFACDGIKVNCVPGTGLTYASVQASDLKFLPTGGDPRTEPIVAVPTNFRNPMAESYTLGMQYQVLPAAVMEVRYVGNHTFDQFQSLNSNPDVLDVQKVFPGYGTAPCTTVGAIGYTRPNCNNTLMETIANTSFSIYNSLQTSLTYHDFHHFTGTASYTFSRTVDNTSEINPTLSGGNTNEFAQDPLNTNIGERGVSGNSYPNVWGIQLAYNEPWFSGQKGILGRALGGYFLNTFYQFNGGQPFTPWQASSVESPYVNANDPKAATGFCDTDFALNFGFGGFESQCRPVLSNPKAPMTSVGINTGAKGYINYVTGAPISASDVHWLWNNQYEAIARNNPFPGVGRNTLRGDSFNNVDLTVGKNVHITERVSMILQASAFNVLNRAYYGTPDPNLEDSLYPTLYGIPNSFLSNYYGSGVGLGSSAGGGAFFQGLGNRNLQLSGKITF